MTIEIRSGYVPKSKRLFENPDSQELRRLTAAMPNARRTIYDNYNVHTRVDARSSRSTYIVTDRPQEHSGQSVTRAEGIRWSRVQDEYIRDREMILVDGLIGNDEKFITPARLIVEVRNANVAAMQKLLYYPEHNQSQPEITIIDTPNLAAPGYPDDRAIFVDLEAGITRVFNSDYFGESKKGGLRMWNKKIYDAGGLALHAGCKVVPVDRGQRVFLIGAEPDDKACAAPGLAALDAIGRKAALVVAAHDGGVFQQLVLALQAQAAAPLARPP